MFAKWKMPSRTVLTSRLSVERGGVLRPEPLDSLAADAMSGCHVDGISLDDKYRAAQRHEDPHPGASDALEDRLGIRRRGANKPQNLGRRCLLGPPFGQRVILLF